MKMRNFVAVVLACLMVFSLNSVKIGAETADQYEYIDIRNPFLRQIPLAVPPFKNVSGSSTESRVSKEASDLLSQSLAFSGYFKVLDQAAFLFNPQRDGIQAPKINFQNWTVIGAELLITGLYEEIDGKVTMELRLFDTFKAKRILGKRYTGRVEDQRRMILRFCSEVIYYLTGNYGVYQSKIAFVSTGSGKKEIYTCEFDGYNPVRLTFNDAITLFPAWSSDGKWMAYTSYLSGKPDIYIKSLSGGAGATIAQEGINITPAWVPGKFELAATLSFAGDQDIYLLTGSGKIIKRLTDKRGSDVSPSWSPDGSRLAFVSNRAGSPQIYVKDLRTDKVNRLTFEGNYNTQPSWSPRGDKIAYSSLVNGRHNIFTIDADGQNPLQLTYDSGDNESPSWSPDGSLIVFSSSREGAFRLFVMTAFGTEQRRLLLLNGEQTNPKWSMNRIKN
jgi:TolB protein